MDIRTKEIEYTYDVLLPPDELCVCCFSALELLGFGGFEVMYVRSLRKEGTKVFETFDGAMEDEWSILRGS